MVVESAEDGGPVARRARFAGGSSDAACANAEVRGWKMES